MRLDHETLATVPWDLVVADEAQHIKNATSSTARNLRTIESRCRVALTGTPVENNLTELWAILDWATPGLLGSRAAFRKVWAAPIESGVDAVGGAPLRPARRAVPAAAAQVRPRHRPRAAGQDRDRPGPRADPRAGGALRVAGPRVDGPHRARRRGHPPRPGARAAHRAEADLQPPRPLPAPAQRPAQGPLGEARRLRRAARHDPRRERLGAGLHPVRRHGAPARTAPGRRLDPDALPPRRHPGPRPRADGARTSRTAPPRSSCSRSRPAAPAST